MLFVISIRCLVLTTVSSLLVLLLFLSDLVLGLLEPVILEVEYLLERIGLFGVTITSESVEDLREFSLTHDRILHFSDLLICEDYMALVDTEFERKEEDGNQGLGALADLHMLKFAVEGVRSSCFLLLGLLVFFCTCCSCLAWGFGACSLRVFGILTTCTGPLVEYLDIEQHVRGEAVFNTQINLL